MNKKLLKGNVALEVNQKTERGKNISRYLDEAEYMPGILEEESTVGLRVSVKYEQLHFLGFLQ